MSEISQENLSKLEAKGPKLKKLHSSSEIHGYKHWSEGLCTILDLSWHFLKITGFILCNQLTMFAIPSKITRILRIKGNQHEEAIIQSSHAFCFFRKFIFYRSFLSSRIGNDSLQVNLEKSTKWKRHQNWCFCTNIFDSPNMWNFAGIADILDGHRVIYVVIRKCKAGKWTIL